ncbi:MAG: hypothetical protein SGI88_01350 [Candidatus Hydrogenedentes bacterium]|nr:hypothetical protein [Candidatus Hydrogenedentota bacterium]
MSLFQTDSLSRRLDTPNFPFIFAAVVYFLFVLVRLAVHDWDVSYFVTAGDAFTDATEAPAGLQVFRDQQGHDGQFYYRLALDPFTDRVTDYGITLDLPAYRHQRLLYPLLAHVLAFGDAGYIPLCMLMINYFGVCAIAWSGSRLMQLYGLHAGWGLALACYPGFVLALARDFNEILAAALVIYALCLVYRQQHWGAAGIFSLGVLTRETSVLVPVAIGITGIFARVRGGPRQAIAPYILPVATGVAWQLYLRYNWGHFAVSDTGTMGLPFVSFAQSLFAKTDFASGQQIAGFVQMLLVAVFAVAAGMAWRSSSARPYEKAAWLVYVGLACIVSGNVWSEDWSFLRNLWELYAFGAIILATSKSRVRTLMFACWGALWVFEMALRTDAHKVWS